MPRFGRVLHALLLGLCCLTAAAEDSAGLRDLLQGLKPSSGATPVELEITLREGDLVRRRRLLVVPGQGIALIRPTGLANRVAWLIDRHHAWAWDAGQTEQDKPSLRARPWRAALNPWGSLLSLQRLDPGRYPIAHWVMIRTLGHRILRPDLCRIERGVLSVDPTALRRHLAALTRRYHPTGLQQPVGIRLAWTFAHRETSWRLIWGAQRTAGRLRITEQQVVGGLSLPKRAVLERRCLSPTFSHVLGKVSITVRATPTRAGLPSPPQLLANGIRFDSTRYLAEEARRSPTDPHVRWQLATHLAAPRDRIVQGNWLAKNGHATEAVILALRSATQPEKRYQLLRDRLEQLKRSPGTPPFANRDMVLGLQLTNSWYQQNVKQNAPYRTLLDKALSQAPDDIGLNGLRWEIDTDSLRSLRDARLAAGLRETRIRILANPKTPLELFRSVLRDIGTKGATEAVRHQTLWAAARSRADPLRADLVRLALERWAGQRADRTASRRLGDHLCQLNLSDRLTESLLELLKLALPALHESDQARLIANIGQAIPRLEPAWRVRLLRMAILSLNSPKRVAAQLAHFVKRSPRLGSLLSSPGQMAWLDEPAKILLALPAERPDLMLLKAQLSIRANQPRTAFLLLRKRLQAKAPPSNAVVTTYSALLLHGTGLPVTGARRPAWLPAGNWMEPDMAWHLYQRELQRHPHPILLHDAGLLAQALGKPSQPLLLRAFDQLTAKLPLDPQRARLASRWTDVLLEARMPAPWIRITSNKTHCQPLLPSEGPISLSLLAEGGKLPDLSRLCWALDAQLLSGGWQIDRVDKALRALAKGPQADKIGLALRTLDADSPSAQLLGSRWAVARGRLGPAQLLLTRLVEEWPSSQHLWSLQAGLQKKSNNWTGLARTLQAGARWFEPKIRRDLMVATISGLLTLKQHQLATQLTEQFCQLHPAKAIYTSKKPLVELLGAGRLEVFEKLFALWAGTENSSQTLRLTKAKLLCEGKRPFEAYAELQSLKKQEPFATNNNKTITALEAELAQRYGIDLPFRWYLRNVRFPKVPQAEHDRHKMLVRQLSNRSFSARRRAATHLASLGERAGRALLRGSRSKDLELRRQCMHILRRLFDRRDR